MKVYLSEYIAPSARRRLEEKYEVVSNFNHPEELYGIIVRRVHITREIIEKAKNLRIVSMHGVGFDTIDVEAAKEYGVKVTNVPGQSAQSVAELAVSFILALSRKHKAVNTGLCKGKYAKFGMEELIGNEVYGKKLGVVGAGRIACKIANIMQNAFDNEVYCYDPMKSAEECSRLGLCKLETLNELFGICDFVSVNVPLLDSTRNMINKDIFENANPDLILVNTARGGIINENDLYDALISSKIKAAASDVFVSEPPEVDNPLIALDNFIATLHVGGSTSEALERVGNCAVDNLINGIESYEEQRSSGYAI